MDYRKLGYYSDTEPVKGELVVIGDTHLSMKYQGTHKDYAKSSIRVLDRIVEIVQGYADKGDTSLVLLGDIFGVNERNINDEAFLSAVGLHFDKLNTLTQGRVYCVRGNHDMGSFTTFDFAISQHWFKNPMTLDYDDNGKVVARFHILNYGQEHRTLPVAEDAVNIGFGHNNFVIPSVTPWYEDEASKWNGNHVDLASADNLEDLDYLVSGHIHTPMISDNMTEVMPNGKVLRLFYLGSPSRVAERYDDSFVMTFTLSPDSVATGIDRFGLWPVNEEFVESELTDDDKVMRKMIEDQNKKFQETINEFMNNKVSIVVGIKDQITGNKMFPDEVKKEALKYYQRRLDNKVK